MLLVLFVPGAVPGAPSDCEDGFVGPCLQVFENRDVLMLSDCEGGCVDLCLLVFKNRTLLHC